MESILTPEWIQPVPRTGEILAREFPGAEGRSIGLVGLHESGRASGCWLFGLSPPPTPCQCATQVREAGNCRLHPVAATPDAGPPDAGPPDAGPPDAGPPDAGPPDAGMEPDADFGEPF